MASLISARRRAEEFAAAVDGHDSRRRRAPELQELVDVVTTLREAEAPAPRPEFSTALRERLMTEAATALSPSSPLVLPPQRRGSRERRLTAAAAVLTLVGGTAGLAAAAQDAVPGDALYPIKRGIEDVRLSIQSDADSKGRAYLQQAQSRLQEADELLADDAPSGQVAETVDSFVVQAVAGTDLLLGSFEDERDPEDVELLRSFAADSLTRLQSLAESAPAEIQDELARAAVVLQRIDQRAASACADCSDLPTLQMPVLMAQAAEISRAMAAVRSRGITNEHPALAVDVPRPAEPGPATGDVAPPREPDLAPLEPQQPSIRVEGPRQLPRDPDQALKGLDDASGGLLGQVGGTAEKTAEDLSKTVDDTLGGTGLTQ
jgi:hypothetical protein